jgi:hypothetical protein
VEIISAGSSADVVFGDAARACSSGVVLEGCDPSIQWYQQIYPLVWDKKLYQNPPEAALLEQLLVGFHLYEQNSVDSLSF